MSSNPGEMDPNDFLMGGGGVRSASFKQLGQSVTGFIARRPDLRQQSDPGTGELKFWKDGSPRMQLRIVLQTEDRDPEDAEDNGLRAVYARGQMRDAIAEAVRKAGASGLEVGGKLRVTYIRDGVSQNRAFNPPKEYEALYRAPEQQPVPVGSDPVAATSNGEQPFEPQPVPHSRDMRSSTLVAADGGQQQQQPVHDPAPF